MRSAGTEPSARVKVSVKDIMWAEIIFVMEKRHEKRLVQNYTEEMKNKKVIVLDIPDEYKYMDTALIDMIKLSVDPYL